jgi:MFS family permease
MFSEAYKRYALAAVTSIYMWNLVDRGLMTLLLQPIKSDLQLSDTQLGFLTGIAFGLFYAVFGLPIARWADRGNRVTIASISIGLWGLTVMASLLVTNYIQLVCARIAAAVGESGCKPPTYSLVGDYFPAAAERTRALAIYVSGNFLSALVSYILGGWLNELYGWRKTFFLMGIPGLVLAVLIKLTIAEPRASASDTRPEQRSLPSMRAVFTLLWGQRSCRHLSIALILLYTLGLGLGPWYAAFMIRSHGMGTAELGIWLGLIFGLGGMAGVLLGGYAASRWFVGNERGQMRVTAAVVASVVPFFVAFLSLPHTAQALGALTPLIMVFSSFLGPTYALMQRLVPDEMRATMMAVVMLLANLIGFGIGPQVVGILSDWMMPSVGSNSLRYAMLLMSFVALWAAYHFWRVGQSVADDLSAIDPRAKFGSPAFEASSASRCGADGSCQHVLRRPPA